MAGTVDNRRNAQLKQHAELQGAVETCMAAAGFEYTWVPPVRSYLLSTEGYDTTRATYSGWFSSILPEEVGSEALGVEYASASAAEAWLDLERAESVRVPARGEETEEWQTAQSNCVQGTPIPPIQPDLATALAEQLILLEAAVLEGNEGVDGYEQCIQEEAGLEFITQPSDLVEKAAFELYTNWDEAPNDEREAGPTWLADRELEIAWATADAVCREPVVSDIAEALGEALDEFEARNSDSLRDLSQAWIEFE